MQYKKVYLILAHKKPNQLLELIESLNDGKSVFFVHLDKRMDVNDFKAVGNLDCCQFVRNREEGRWGGFGIVQGTLNGMAEIVTYMSRYYPNCHYHCIVLSGEGLPLKSNTVIHDFLVKQQNFSLISHWKLPYENWWDGGLFRFKSLYCFDYKRYPRWNIWLNKVVKTLRLYGVLPINRLHSHYPDIQLYGSSQWMILSKRLVEGLSIDTLDKKRLKKIFETVLLPDETFIVTYVYNFLISEVKYLKNIKTHLIVFKGNNDNPEYLSVSDIKKEQGGTMLFARKFDRNKNPEAMGFVLKHLDK